MAPSIRSIDLAEDALARLRLDDTARSAGALVVESSVDAEVFAEVLGLDIAFFPVGGRNNVLRIADALAENYLRGIVCVADTDFDHEPANRVAQWFLVFTDEADIDAVLFWSPAFERVIRSWGSATKLEELGGVDSLRDLILEAVSPVSALRHANAVGHCGWRFAEVPLAAVVSLDDLQLNLDNYLRRLATASGAVETDLRAAAQSEPPECPHCGHALARGKDCYAAADLALRKLVGSVSHQQTKDGLLRRALPPAVRASDMVGQPLLERIETALARALAEAA